MSVREEFVPSWDLTTSRDMFDLQPCMPKMASSALFFCTHHINTLFKEGIKSSLAVFRSNSIASLWSDREPNRGVL